MRHDSRPYLYSLGSICLLVHYERGGEMKQTFDDLRGAILDKAFKVYDGTIAVDIHDVGELINAAEAKLEAEECEWKPHGTYGWIITPPHKEGAARNRADIKNRPYCAVCGKRIKIAEVE